MKSLERWKALRRNAQDLTVSSTGSLDVERILNEIAFGLEKFPAEFYIDAFTEMWEKLTSRTADLGSDTGFLAANWQIAASYDTSKIYTTEYDQIEWIYFRETGTPASENKWKRVRKTFAGGKGGVRGKPGQGVGFLPSGLRSGTSDSWKRYYADAPPSIELPTKPFVPLTASMFDRGEIWVFNNVVYPTKGDGPAGGLVGMFEDVMNDMLTGYLRQFRY